MFCFAKYLSQSPFFEKFLKSEGVCSPCYCDSPENIFTAAQLIGGPFYSSLRLTASVSFPTWASRCTAS